MNSLDSILKRHCWLVITLALVLTFTLCLGNGRTAGNEPIREPVYDSPRIYKNIDGSIVFKEFFNERKVNRIEFYDPDSGELLYGSSLQDGKQVGKREGSAVFEVEISKFDKDIVEKKLLTDTGYGLVITEYKGELVEYRAYLGRWKYESKGKTFYESLTVSVHLEKGKTKDEHRRIIFNNELVDFRRRFESDTYEELYFHNDRTRTYREYKSGFLWHEAQRVPAEGGGNLTPYSAFYLRGRLAFIIKKKFKYNFIEGKRNWYTEETAIYDALGNLVDKVNPLFGESLHLKEEIVDGRNALQVVRGEQYIRKKVIATKFEDK